MELYYKNLISEEASLEKLVDNLMLLVQGADELAEAAGSNMAADKKEEIHSRLRRLKEGCRRVKEQALASALATDKLLRQYPYSSVGFAFAVGILAGKFLIPRRTK
jgi:ElaB/YqjD/DUF883 family membrane-anchored ribosome-binding protein